MHLIALARNIIMKIIKATLKWIAVAISVFGMVVAQKQFFPFVLFLLAALVIMPFLRGLLERKIPIFRTKGLTGVVWLGLFVLGCIFWSPIDPHIKRLEAQKNVDELIQIVETRGHSDYQAAEALGNIGDKRAVTPLIGVVEDASVSSVVRGSAIEALEKLPDRSALLPLGKVLSSDNADMAEKAELALKAIAITDPKSATAIIPDLIADDGERTRLAQRVLVAMGPSVTDELLSSLKSETVLNKSVVIETLGEIRDPRAIEPLFEYLTDWVMKSDAGMALAKLNWQPQTDRERVYYWVALEQGAMLNEHWAVTKQVLMADVKSGQRYLIDYALYAFITIGNQDVIPALVDALHAQENQEMALAYLNCGESTLEAAGETWAKDRGYEVYQTEDASARKVVWGGMKQ
jgi:HEAT repeat protein